MNNNSDEPPVLTKMENISKQMQNSKTENLSQGK